MNNNSKPFSGKKRSAAYDIKAEFEDKNNRSH